MPKIANNPIPSQKSTPKHIVHREQEWELIEAEIRRRRVSPLLPKSVIVLFGTGGIGKTTFLDNTLIPRIKEKYPYLPWAKIDFDKEYVDNRYDGVLGRGHLILDILSEITKHREASVSKAFERANQNWETVKTNLESETLLSEERQRSLSAAEEDLIKVFHNYLGFLVEKENSRPPIIIMDTVEDADHDLLGWIQESLQTPSTDSGYVLWIMASRQPLDCQPFYLRPRYFWQHLRPFSEDEIRKQVPEHSDLASNIRKYSQGLPAATWEISSTLLRIEKRTRKKLKSDQLEKYSSELILSLSDLLSLERYLGGLKDDEALKEGLRILAPLRLFNVTIVAQLLPEILPNHYQRATIGGEALSVIQKMVGTKLVSWDRARRGYVIEEPIRQIIALILENNQPDIYASIHRWAEERYAEWAMTVEAKRRDYIVERLYHKAIILLKLEKTTNAVDHLTETLKQTVQNYYIHEEKRDEEAIDELKQQLMSDQDFAEFLRPEEIEQILEALQF